MGLLPVGKPHLELEPGLQYLGKTHPFFHVVDFPPQLNM